MMVLPWNSSYDWRILFFRKQISNKVVLFFLEASPELSESVSYESAGGVSPEFLKKLEEWERLKAVKGNIIICALLDFMYLWFKQL